MNTIKTRYVVFLLISTLLLNGGCSAVSGDKSAETAESVMRGKYNEEFRVIETRSLNGDSFYAWMSPVDDSDIVFRAEITNDGSWATDDYIVKILCHEITEHVDSELYGYPGEHFVYTKNILEYSLEESKDVTAQEHLTNNPGDRFDIVIFVEKGSLDPSALYRAVINIKRNIGFSKGSINVIAIDGSMAGLRGQVRQYDDLKSDEVQEAINKGNKIIISLDPCEIMPTYEEFRAVIEK